MIDLRDMTPEEVERRFQCRHEEYEFRVYVKDDGGFVGMYKRRYMTIWNPCRWVFDGTCTTAKGADLIPRHEEVEVWAFAVDYGNGWEDDSHNSRKAAEATVAHFKASGYRTAGPERVVLKEHVE